MSAHRAGGTAPALTPSGIAERVRGGASMALCLLGTLAAASACKTGPTQTQVIVLIDAERDVRARTAKLQVDVYSEDDGKKSISESLTPKWPVELALAPKDHDASRTYRVSADARDKGGETVAVARLVSGYVEGEKLFVILKLEDACINPPSACEDASHTCHAGACISAHVDAKHFATSRDDAPVAGDLLSQSDAGPDTREDGGPEPDGGQPGEGEPGLGEPGDACSTAGERSCSGHASTVPLICRGGQWEVGQVCKSDERCDSAKGETLGHCLPIADECKGRHAQEPFCADDAIRECADLVSFEDRPCQDHATCSDKSGDASCVCKAGFSAKGSDCVDIDECKTKNGGCDSAAECTNTTGSRKCGACPAGYTGNGEAGCIPLLLDLALSQGALSPAFDQDTDSYDVQLPIGAQTFELTPSLPQGTVLEIDGTEVASDDTWISPVLDLGSIRFELKLIHDDQEVVYTLHVERGSTLDYIKASNTGNSDQFGWSVAISSGTLVVGAPFEDSAATGVNNTVVGQDNEAADASGAAYVFVRSKGSWKQQAYLKASNTDASDQFGYSVSISGDTIVVGAIGEASSYTGVNPDNGQEDDSQTYAGAAYVFVREAGAWHQQAYLKASNAQTNDEFGYSVAISGDTIVVGALAESSVFAGVNGTPADQADNMASYAGAAYVFARSNGTWVQDAYLKASNSEASDEFGQSVAVSGDTIVVGAPYEDSSTPGPHTTSSGSNNDASASGAAYVFVRKPGGWQQQAYLKAVNPGSGDVFGYSVSIWTTRSWSAR